MKPGAGWFSHPVLSLLLAAAWLLLQRSLAPAQLLTAALLALLVPRLVHGLLGPGVRLRSVGTALRLAGVVLWDILVANLAVARLVLNPAARPRPAWVPVPLTLTHPTAVSLLASIVTTTPGTVSCVVDEERREILVHALDCADPGALVADIQRRYEAPLREIFE
ncbi:Na+/H+ antiporter subunit E [Piscinibacter defluvii]|uniref:Na+/H+ antiporter subunit E n=1 Tax=Piscinibacter defluvii TaxID=1796922 RepID=UPI000FDE7E12|nr:Na+/H+ antiporter subunit E [Piscinibacter defluvii]